MYKYLLPLLILAACKEPSVPQIEEKSNVAYVVSGVGKQVDVIDLIGHTVVETYPLQVSSDRFPHHIYISDDKRKLAIATPAYDFSKGHSGLHGLEVPGGIKVLDADTGEELMNIAVPFANHNATFSRDGNEIWTSVFSHSGRAHIHNAERGNAVGEVILDADPSEIIITPDGKYAAVASGESTFLQLINTSSRQLEKRIKVDLAPSNVWPGYGDIVLVSNALRKSVNFVNLASFNVTDFIDFDFVPGFVIYNKSRAELWVCEGAGGKVHIFKKDPEWSEVGTLSFPDEDPHMIKFYDQDKQALLITQQSSKVYFINSETREITGSVAVGAKPNGIAIKE